ncbi:hypothetical protein ACFFWC_07600 [Plantactinospora siamensis]|uniref:Uncharacterized protein n=1 Tax=Plantactinospora siamensis TaxID=555372 RepID=A0ABV6NZJ4_9ACTN
MSVRRRTLLAGGAALPAVTLASAALPGTALAAGATADPAPAANPATASRRRRPLTNLAHLDFLGAGVRPARVPGHDTYRLAAEPEVGVLWTYADRQPDGSYRRVGGGTYDPATGYYGQGAYNADDIARAAVVYLRHWQQTGAATSRRSARQLLRGLAFLQTTTGPHAGNVVLWMQYDGTLNPSADPVEQPDPSDSGPSFWLARAIWALGEGQAAFRRDDPDFAGFLRERLDLAIAAVRREVLNRYGQWDVADGHRVPGWLIVGGADATGEAILGLAAYVRSGAPAAARTALAQLAEGVAAMAAGEPDRWPYGAVLPTVTSRSIWHAWGAQMPTALAAAATALHRPGLLGPAVSDTAGLTPELLTTSGCDNGWLPTPVDRTQIAYGVDARLRSLLAVADATGHAGLTRLAALTAAWYFGGNHGRAQPEPGLGGGEHGPNPTAGTPMYDPATGRTFDGLAGDGTVNRNSGAESTIHGLLSMLALDATPAVAAVATRLTAVADREGLRVIEAEAGAPTGPAEVVRPDSAWTGESQYSGGAYLALGDGGGASWSLPDPGQPLLVSPVVDLVPDRHAGRTVWRAGSAGHGGSAGRIDHGTAGAPGVTPVPGALLPVPLSGPVPAGATLTVRAEGVGGDPLRIDALLVRAVVARLVLGGAGTGAALLHNGTAAERSVTVALPGRGSARVEVFDRYGRAAGRVRHAGGPSIRVTLPGYGFAVVTRA